VLTISSIIRKKQYQIDRLNPVSKNFCINDSLLAKTLTEFLIFHISFFISKLKQFQSKVLHFMGNTICVVEAYPIP